MNLDILNYKQVIIKTLDYKVYKMVYSNEYFVKYININNESDNFIFSSKKDANNFLKYVKV